MDAAGLTIWGRLDAFNVQKVVWAADEVGRAFVRHDAGRGFDPVDRAMNPNGRVPVIDDDGFVLWESNVIVRYLFARYGGDRYPSDLQARMSAERWMDWQAADVLSAYRPVYNVLSRGRSDFTPEQAEAGYARTLSLFEILDAHLGESAHVGGETFGMADIPLGVQAHDLFMIGREVTGLANVKRWYAGLKGRPRARRAFAALPVAA